MTHNNSDKLFESLSALMDGEASELEFHRILKQLDSNTELRERWRRYHTISSILNKERTYGAEPQSSLMARVSLALESEKTYGQADGAPTSAADLGEQSKTKSKPKRGAVRFMRDVFGKTAVAASVAAAFIIAIPTLKTGFDPSADQVEGQAVLANSKVGQTLDSSFATLRLSADEDLSSSSATEVPSGFQVKLPEARVVSSAASAPLQRTLQVHTQQDQLSRPEVQTLLNQLLMEHANRASVNSGMGVLPYARVNQIDVDVTNSAYAQPAVNQSGQ